MRWRFVLFAVLGAGAVLAAGLFVGRERMTDHWIQMRLKQRLAWALGAEVEVQGVEWRSGVLRVGLLRIGGGDLPLEHLEARDLRTEVDWRALLAPAEEPLRVAAAEVEVVWRNRGGTGGPASGAAAAPPLDLQVERLHFRHGAAGGWSMEGSSVRALGRGGAWSFTGRGGSLALPERGSFEIREFSAEHAGGRWRIGHFDGHDGRGGELAGSAAQDLAGSWSGEFSWQDIDIVPWLPEAVAGRAEGKGRGKGVLEDGRLSGRMEITGARTMMAGPFVTLAGLLDREDWHAVPWQEFQFDFTRHADGSVDFSALQAVSDKGLAVRGAGHYAPDRIGADLELGVRRAGRPYLTAFMPVLFSHEGEGYLWTTVRLGGTPRNPTENLSARLVEAVTVVPAAGALDAAVEVPAAAGEAVGGLLRGVLGR